MTQSIREQIRTLSAIKAECHLVKVGGEVLCADLVPAYHDAAFQQREGALNGVGMNVAVNVNFVTMANCFVLLSADLGGNHCFRISWHFVGDHHVDVRTNVFLNVLRQCAGLSITRVEEAKFSAALTYSRPWCQPERFQLFSSVLPP